MMLKTGFCILSYHYTSTHVIMAMPEIPYEKGVYYIFDRGYNDFSNLFYIEQIEATFVVRDKKNLKFKQISWERRLSKNVLSDSIIEFTVYKSSKDYLIPLRRVAYYDVEQNREFVFLTNDFSLPAFVVAELYRTMEYRIILRMAQAVPQNQEVLGASENAVRI